MPVNCIYDLHIGKVDGKNEFSPNKAPNEQLFNESFVIPENIYTNEIEQGKKYFIKGFRGTGKTSLLRWHAGKLRDRGYVGKFILFKSDLSETKKQRISNQIGAEWSAVSSSNMEILQDFKDAWIWYILHKIGEIIRDYPDATYNNNERKKFLRILGIGESTPFTKKVGFLPKMEGMTIKITADLKFFRAELAGC